MKRTGAAGIIILLTLIAVIALTLTAAVSCGKKSGEPEETNTKAGSPTAPEPGVQVPEAGEGEQVQEEPVVVTTPGSSVDSALPAEPVPQPQTEAQPQPEPVPESQPEPEPECEPEPYPQPG